MCKSYNVITRSSTEAQLTFMIAADLQKLSDVMTSTPPPKKNLSNYIMHCAIHKKPELLPKKDS